MHPFLEVSGSFLEVSGAFLQALQSFFEVSVVGVRALHPSLVAKAKKHTIKYSMIAMHP